MLRVGLNSWLLPDFYGDFEVGETRGFALEYINEGELRLLPKSRSTRGHTYLDGCRYAVTGRAIHETPEWSVIDIGVPACGKLPSASLPPPARFEGVVWLSPAPAIYYLNAVGRAGMPPLILDWRIRRIEMQQGPLIERDGLSDYDPAHLKSTDVQDTREGEDFLLHCELISGVARRDLTPR
jgi:hypothetical protein